MPPPSNQGFVGLCRKANTELLLNHLQIVSALLRKIRDALGASRIPNHT